MLTAFRGSCSVLFSFTGFYISVIAYYQFSNLRVLTCSEENSSEGQKNLPKRHINLRDSLDSKNESLNSFSKLCIQVL